ncbi:MAG: GNAT family N-acetyltransferase, partial [Porphyromonas sp.]
FVKQDFDYVQPPYREGGVSVPLHLMATANLTQDMLISLKQTLYQLVYRQK